MIDRIADYKPGENASITVVKHVTFNEPYITGHYPDNPVMPGVMIAEVFSQASEYLSLLNDFTDRYQNEWRKALVSFDDVAKALTTDSGVATIIAERKRIIGYLVAQNIKFKHVVFPGDSLYVTSQLTAVDEKGFCHYNVEARVGRHIASCGRIINYRSENKQSERSGR
ncbi:beta-hydroxyacyl-ACP dehydratase [Winslowiella iniecta]|nr:beta-hydroxyacyl-ACP dehydratase [Winslowiella iniecta]